MNRPLEDENDDLETDKQSSLRKQKVSLERQLSLVPKDNENKTLQIKRQLTSVPSNAALSQKKKID